MFSNLPALSAPLSVINQSECLFVQLDENSGYQSSDCFYFNPIYDNTIQNKCQYNSLESQQTWSHTFHQRCWSSDRMRQNATECQVLALLLQILYFSGKGGGRNSCKIRRANRVIRIFLSFTRMRIAVRKHGILR